MHRIDVHLSGYDQPQVTLTSVAGHLESSLAIQKSNTTFGLGEADQRTKIDAERRQHAGRYPFESFGAVVRRKPRHGEVNDLRDEISSGEHDDRHQHYGEIEQPIGDHRFDSLLAESGTDSRLWP